VSLIQKAQRACVVSYIFALAVQFYAAGLGLFGATGFGTHALLGYGLIIGAATLTGLTVAARFPRRTVLLAATLIPLTVLQPVLALTLRVSAPALAALHIVNALLIFTLAMFVAHRTRPNALRSGQI
jgi:hypothetical protein